MFWMPIVAGLGLLHMGSKLFGSDPDFTQAYMLNKMSGNGGFFKTYFEDGLKSLFFGSRTMSAAMSSGNPMAAMMYGSPYMARSNPYMANPYLMSQMPYNPMAFGSQMWGGGRPLYA
jgi:hypothetical protein